MLNFIGIGTLSIQPKKAMGSKWKALCGKKSTSKLDYMLRVLNTKNIIKTQKKVYKTTKLEQWLNP